MQYLNIPQTHVGFGIQPGGHDHHSCTCGRTQRMRCGDYCWRATPALSCLCARTRRLSLLLATCHWATNLAPTKNTKAATDVTALRQSPLLFRYPKVSLLPCTRKEIASAYASVAKLCGTTPQTRKLSHRAHRRCVTLCLHDLLQSRFGATEAAVASLVQIAQRGFVA